MCSVSMIADYWKQQLPTQTYWQGIQPQPNQFNISLITRAEFDQLKNDVEELKKLLVAAKRYDEATKQPDCESEDKVALIKKIADLVGVDMKDVFGE